MAASIGPPIVLSPLLSEASPSSLPSLSSHSQGSALPPSAAEGLEALFLRQILSQVRTTSLFHEGTSGETFRDMLNDALAGAMANAGGIGLASALKEMGGTETGAQGNLQPSVAPRVVSQLRAQMQYGASNPCSMPISSAFGWRRDPVDGERRMHHGVDIPASLGTPVHAARFGTVVRTETDPGYGRFVVVDHGDGWQTRYAHLADIHVHEGQEVDENTRLGTVGTTGRSTGPHLHLELRKQGIPVDPLEALGPLKILR